MDSTPPKYMNSPQTSIYDKGRTIFGLSHARKAISEAQRALLVEGYFDVIMAHQNGVQVAVASSGTAVTAEQMKTLRRYASELLLCLDTDEAGRHATQRAIESAARAGLAARVVELPNAKDPGEFFLKTPQLWGEAEGAALAGWEWWINGLLAEHDIDSADGRARAASAVVAVLNRIPEEATLDIYCQVAAERLRLDPAGLLADVQRYRRGGPARAEVSLALAEIPATAPVDAIAPARPEEERLLGLLLSDQRSVAILEELTAGEPFGSAELQDLCARVVAAVGEGVGTLERQLEQFSPEERARLARLSLVAAPSSDERLLRAALQDCVDRIRLKSYESAMAAIEQKLAAASGDEAVRDGLLAEHRRLAEQRTALKDQLFQGRV
jgi:DNA primase